VFEDGAIKCFAKCSGSVEFCVAIFMAEDTAVVLLLGSYDVVE